MCKNIFLLRLPDNVSLDAGALVEPLAVAVHACENRAQMKAGEHVFISGAGIANNTVIPDLNA